MTIPGLALTVGAATVASTRPATTPSVGVSVDRAPRSRVAGVTLTDVVFDLVAIDGAVAMSVIGAGRPLAAGPATMTADTLVGELLVDSTGIAGRLSATRALDGTDLVDLTGTWSVVLSTRPTPFAGSFAVGTDGGRPRPAGRTVPAGRGRRSDARARGQPRDHRRSARPARRRRTGDRRQRCLAHARRRRGADLGDGWIWTVRRHRHGWRRLRASDRHADRDDPRHRSVGYGVDRLQHRRRPASRAVHRRRTAAVGLGAGEHDDDLTVRRRVPRSLG